MTATFTSGRAPKWTASPPPAEPVVTDEPALRVTPPTRWEELGPGLLLFFSRPSRLQSWAERWGHPFRHVGITVQTPDGVRVASYSASQCYRIDDLEDLMPNYDRVAVASVGASDDEKRAISEWCASFENLERKEAPYTKSAFAIGPLMDVARRRRGPVRTVLLAILVLYCKFEDVLERRRPAFICSTFVWRALVECTDNRVRLPMTAHPGDQAAYATAVTPTDELLARWLCGPGDLWRGISQSHRSELELDHLLDTTAADDPDDLVIDLRDCREADPVEATRVEATRADPGPADRARADAGHANCGARSRGFRSATGLVRAGLVVTTFLFAERLLGNG